MPGSLKVLAGYLMWAFLVLYWPLFGAIKKQITASGMLSIFMETLMVVPVALIYLVAFSYLEGLGPRDFLLIPTMGIVTTVPLLFFAVGMKDTSLP